MLSWLATLALAQVNLDAEHARVDGSVTGWRGGTSVDGRDGRVLTLAEDGRASQTAYGAPHPGGPVTLSGWVKGAALIRLSGGDVRASETAISEDWVELSVTAAVPAGAWKLELSLEAGAGGAWFDDLALDDPTDTFRPLDLPGEDDDAPAFTDGLTAAVEPADVPVDAAAELWVREVAVPWASAHDEDVDDLSELAAHLGAHRIVQLGEAHHELAPYQSAKVRLIRALHEQQGFDVVALESGLWECERAAHPSRTARQALEQCAFPIFHTEELLELFTYAASTRDSERPLRITGMDVQRTTPYGREQLGPWAGRLVGRVDPARAHQIRRTLSTYQVEPDVVADHHRWVTEHRASLIEGGATEPDLDLLTQVLVGHETLLRHRADRGAGLRDQGMADNTRWLAETRYPGQKIITWAHNFHVRERGSDVSHLSMGEVLAETYGDDLFTVGLFARGGTTTLGRDPVRQRDPLPHSLEAVMSRGGHKLAFVPLDGDAPWGAERVPTYDQGWQREDSVPSDQFDGVLFFDRVAPAAPLAPDRWVMRDVRVVDAHGERTVPELAISGGRIVGDGAVDPARTAWPRVDSEGLTVVPGLVDAHVHLSMTPGGAFLDLDREAEQALWRQHLAAYVASGVAAVLDTGIPVDDARTFEELTEQGPSPEVVWLGPLVSPHGGYVAAVLDAFEPTPDPETLTRQLEAFDALDPLGVKVTMEDGMLRPIWPFHTDTVMQALRDQPRPLFVHALETHEYERGLTLQPTAFVHPPDEVDDALIEALDGVSVVSTISVMDSLLVPAQPERLTDPLVVATVPELERTAAADPARQRASSEAVVAEIMPKTPGFVRGMVAGLLTSPGPLDKRIAKQGAAVRALHEAGITVVAGSDSGNWPLFLYEFHGPTTVRELELLQDAGIPAAEVITIGTLNGAQLLRLDDELGSIEAGKRASFLAVRGDPLQDLAALRDTAWIAHDGVRDTAEGWMRRVDDPNGG